MEKITDDKGKEKYEGVTNNTQFDSLDFYLVTSFQFEDDKQYALHTNLGSLTILNRMTGFGYRDIETGYTNPDGKFWLATGHMDVRNSGAKTIGEAIDWVQTNANACIGI